jgi:uncharacterized protein (UPF0335 family)
MAAGLWPNEGGMSTPGTSAAELRSFVERIQRLEGEIADINSDKRDVYTEAKSKGFDVTALKAVVAYLRKDREKAEEQRSVFELYLGQVANVPLGTGNATRARARATQLAASTSSPPTRGDEAVPSGSTAIGTASPIPEAESVLVDVTCTTSAIQSILNSAADPTRVTSLPGGGNLAGEPSMAPGPSIPRPLDKGIPAEGRSIATERKPSLPAAPPIPDTDESRGGVESRHAAVHGESRRTLESAREGSAAIAPSVTRGPHREDAAGVAPGPRDLDLLLDIRNQPFYRGGETWPR